jgi:putative transposase
MPQKRIQFENDKYYHLYNRGVDKRVVFSKESDYYRFLISMQEFNTPDPIGSLFARNIIKASEALKPRKTKQEPDKSIKLVEFIAFCLNPNHFHLLVRQLVEGGISKFMQKLQMGYTNFFNLQYDRSGSLLQGKFKVTEIGSTDLLDYISAYINGNPEIHGLRPADSWKWSSCSDYLGSTEYKLCDVSLVMRHFKNTESYKEYLRHVIEESSSIKNAKKRAEFLE